MFIKGSATGSGNIYSRGFHFQMVFMSLASGCLRHWRYFLLLSYLLLAPVMAAAQAQLPPPSAPPGRLLVLEQSRERLSGHLEFLFDARQNLSFEDILKPANQARFTALPGELNEGYRDGVGWLRFTVARPAHLPPAWWLEVLPSGSEQLALYIPDGSGHYQIMAGGLDIPLSQRAVAYRASVFKLLLPATVPQTFYMKIVTRNPLSGRLTLWQPERFVQAVALEQLGFGLYLGAYAVLVLASLWFERAVRDGVYIAFGLYVLSCIFMTVATTGILYQYVLSDHPQWALRASGVSIALSVASCAEFFFRFVGMPQRHPRLTRICLRSVWLWTILIIVLVFLDYGLVQEFQMFTTAFVIAPVGAIVLFKPALRSTREVRYTFIAGGMLLLLTILVRFAIALGYVESSADLEYVTYAGSMLLFLIIYYSISRRYYAMRAAKEVAQIQALALSRRTEHELETQVMARTDELMAAMKTVETALQQERVAHEEQRQFIATVSHELRTPLAVIDATTQNLTREAGGAPSKMQARLEKISQATARLSSLFDNYLSSNRLDVLSHGVHPCHTLLRPLLEDAVAAATPLANGHRLEIEGAGLPDTVWADPDLLRLVLRTLADNAVKYTRPATRVVFRAGHDASGWHIDIQDNGTGIAAEEQHLIFQRYYRGAAAGNLPGTGLGLSLARRLVEMHGGTLTLQPAAATGCTFRIWLPAAPPDTPHAA